MFHTSSQRKHWMFSSQDEVQNLRVKVNSEYIEKYRQTSNEEVGCLTVEEEKKLVDYYQLVLADLQAKFKPLMDPPMPNVAVATAIAYMKRFYLKTSVMDHPPREMYLVFLYMACKLDFHMTIHNAYRPLEGFIIDIKTRLNINPDQWRSKAEHFLLLSLRTDASFFNPPSQLALAALHYGCESDDIIKYMMSLGNSDKNRKLIEQIRSIVKVVTFQKPLVAKDEIKALEQKLKGCRNPDNNPEGKVTKRKKKIDNSESAEKELVVPMEINN
ncbi:Cyclin-H [Exaiptasia diaphana]|nr:Cyclin-H [Exaiptasia diaphana]